LANTDGGLLVLGVGEGGDIVGLQDPGRTEAVIRSAAQNVSPSIAVEVNHFSFDGLKFVIARISKGEQPPHTVGGQAYQRVGDRVVRLTETDRSSEFDVFLAHNAGDKSPVIAIANVLKARGIRVWLDSERIRPGQRFQDEIQQALKNAKAVVVVIGPTGLGQWQAEEIRIAITLSVREGIAVIPVLLPGVDKLPATIPSLAEFNWVRFLESPNEEENIERLLWGITGRRPPSASRNGMVAVTDERTPQETPKPTSTNPGIGIPGRSGKVVVGLHGIMTHAGWARSLYEVGSNAGWQVRMDRWNFGYFSLVQFILPWARRTRVQWFRRVYTDEMENRKVLLSEGELPSVVAHSFGTYILGNALLKYDWLRFNKVILCGSILPQDFPWEKLIERGQIQAVRNEYATNDLPTRLVRWFVAGTGPSGREAFGCSHERFEQDCFKYTHSEYFDKGHMEAKWLPFLRQQLPHIPVSNTTVEGPRGSRPWGLYAIYAVLIIAVVLFARWCGLLHTLGIGFSSTPSPSIGSTISADGRESSRNKLEISSFGFSEEYQQTATSGGWPQLDLRLRNNTGERVFINGIRLNIKEFWRLQPRLASISKPLASAMVPRALSFTEGDLDLLNKDHGPKVIDVDVRASDGHEPKIQTTTEDVPHPIKDGDTDHILINYNVVMTDDRKDPRTGNKTPVLLITPYYVVKMSVAVTYNSRNEVETNDVLFVHYYNEIDRRRVLYVDPRFFEFRGIPTGEGLIARNLAAIEELKAEKCLASKSVNAVIRLIDEMCEMTEYEVNGKKVNGYKVFD
jgi:pimeloyl-ACP methyl ester carboxylesterase